MIYLLCLNDICERNKAGLLMKHRFSMCLLLLLSLVTLTIDAKEVLSIEILGEEFSVDRHPASGNQLILFISTGYEMPERINSIAAGVAALGIEFWHVDLLENLFLPKAASTFRNMDGRYVAGLITQAHALSGKQVTVMTRAYASIPTLRGIRKWQQQQAAGQNKLSQIQTNSGGSASIYLNGVILLSPELFIKIPELGLEPLFAPVASATNIPVVLFQSGSRGNRWQLHKVIDKLQQGGAQVYSKLFPGVTGIFYAGDTAAETINLLTKLPDEIIRANQLLVNTHTPIEVQPVEAISSAPGGNLDTSLRPFKGNPVPSPLSLFTVQGEKVNHTDYTGKVTLVNFWASWCGPCVEEIPSLNRLLEKMKGKPFELISIDYAEQRDNIREFMKAVDVDFPVLLDTDGKVSALWNVVVFPSTFVIAPDGTIVYGVKGGIHWDTPEIMQKITDLMDDRSY